MAEKILSQPAEQAGNMKTVSLNALKRYGSDLLTAGGFSPQCAEDTADVLVWANARGTNSHGVLRIPRYIEMVEKGIIDPEATLTEAEIKGAVAAIDAQKLPGATAMIAAANQATDLATKFGVGWCSMKNITHAGAVGYYGLQCVKRGCIGIVMSASKPLMAYHGASVSGVSTNPITVAVPMRGNYPLLLDMSTSTVALGKIMHAKDAGTEMPLGWAIDENGLPTSDPDKVSTLTPMGGPKGSGLSLMIEVLASVLISNPVISEALAGNKSSMNGLVIAVHVNGFTNQDQFAQQIISLVAALKGLPKADGVDEILMPGERGFKMAEVRSAEGIPLPEGTINRLADLANRLNVQSPTFI